MVTISSISLRSPIMIRFSTFVAIILLTTQCRYAVLSDIIFTLSKDGVENKKIIVQDATPKALNTSKQDPALQTLQTKGEESADTIGFASEASIGRGIERGPENKTHDLISLQHTYIH